MKENVEEIIKLSLLYDYYGELLPENKRDIFEDYVLNDLSLSEIAENEGMSKQAVHESFKKCEKELKKYDSTLDLINKDNDKKEKISEAINILKEIEQQISPEIKEKTKKITELLNKII